MMTSWFVFQIRNPGPELSAVCWMPARSLEEARAKLQAMAYKGAPVESWPFLGVTTEPHMGV